MEKIFRGLGNFWLYTAPITGLTAMYTGLITMGKHGFGSAGYESFREATNFSEPWGPEEFFIASGGAFIIPPLILFVMLMTLRDEAQKRQTSSIEDDLDEVQISPRNSDPFEALIRRK